MMADPASGIRHEVQQLIQLQIDTLSRILPDICPALGIPLAVSKNHGAVQGA